MLIAIAADSTDPARGILWGGLAVDSLLGSAIVAVDGYNSTNFCILDSQSRPFICTSESAYALPAMVPRHGDSLREHTHGIEFEFGGEEYLGTYREVYLSAVFGADPWAVAITESKGSIYASLDIFRVNFPIGILIGLTTAVFATVVIVRRMMDPLEQLTEGTRRISRRDHSARVSVESNNEFGELAASFNEMASRIGRQFDQLAAGREIDQAVLNAPDHADAVRALLKGVGKVLSSSQRSVLVLEPGAQDTANLYWAEGCPGRADAGLDPGGSPSGMAHR
jgi:HAMP domain-containing protein